MLDIQGLYLARQHGLSGIRSVGRPIDHVAMRFAVPQGCHELLELLNDGLAAVRSEGLYDEIYDRWFGILKPEGVPPARVAALLAGFVGIPLSLLALALAWSRTLQHQVASRTRELETAQREQRALERGLHQARKMEVLGRLAGSVAHDVNNMLTAILGNAGLVRERVPNDATADQFLSEIETAGESAARLTDQLLAFGRNRIPQPAATTWNEAVNSHYDLLRRLIPKSIELRRELA